jgi:hypothetical protein
VLRFCNGVVPESVSRSQAATAVTDFFKETSLKNKTLALLPLAGVLLLFPMTLLADIDFSFSGGGISGSGVFTLATTADPTIDHITGITGIFSDLGDSVSGPISGLVASAYSNTCPGAANFSPAGYSYDNLYYPHGSPAICGFDYPFSGGVLDIFGVLFNVNDAGTTYAVDLWSNGVVPGAGLLYGVSVAQGTTTINDGQNGSGVPIPAFTATVTPEPGYLFVVGVLLLGLIAFRIRKPSSSTIA